VPIGVGMFVKAIVAAVDTRLLLHRAVRREREQHWGG
jgi:hypothetical protein